MTHMGAQTILSLPGTLAQTPVYGGPGSGHSGFWLGKHLGASEAAANTEWVFMFIMWVNIIAFVGLMAIMFSFMWRFRRSRQATAYQVSAAHNTPLELAWSIIPFIVMVPMFWWGMTGYVDKLATPPDAQEIYVTGKKWNWSFRYPGGEQAQDFVKITKTGIDSPVFVVEKGRPVKLTLTSDDVLHAFYIPDFRVKMDVIPNRFTSLTFTPREVGDHIIYCAEYCGEFHSEMHALLRVVERQEFTTTLADWAEVVKGVRTPRQVGELLYTLKGCATCHSIDGKAGTGPSWKGIYGQTHEFTDGTTALVDDNYLREAILYSQKQIVKGYGANMPVYAGQLTNDEVFYLIRYIKSLSDKMSAEEMKMMDVKIEEQPDMPGAQPKQ